MPTIPLTPKKIETLKPKPGERLVYFDSAIKAEGLGGGLCLRAGQSSKTFYALFYQNGKPAYFKLGRYPKLGLKEARGKCREFLENPDAALEAVQGGSFKEVSEEYLERYVAKKGLRSDHEIERLLTSLVYPRWKNKRFRDITRGEITKLLDKIEDKNGARQADNVLSILRKMFNWFETRNDNYQSPIIRGMNRTSVKETARNRILSDDEIRKLWTATEEMGTFGALVRFALLTGQRRSKLACRRSYKKKVKGEVKKIVVEDGLRWGDIEAGVWNIHTEEREKGNPGVLPLSDMALKIIADQPKINGNPYVFAASKGDGPFNSFSKRKKELDEAMGEGIEHWVIHDLRRTCRSLLARAGVMPHIAERVLGHAIPGVEGVYDRHSYAHEKADALEKLAKLIDLILKAPAKGENVLELKRK